MSHSRNRYGIQQSHIETYLKEIPQSSARQLDTLYDRMVSSPQSRAILAAQTECAKAPVPAAVRAAIGKDTELAIGLLLPEIQRTVADRHPRRWGAISSYLILGGTALSARGLVTTETWSRAIAPFKIAGYTMPDPE